MIKYLLLSIFLLTASSKLHAQKDFPLALKAGIKDLMVQQKVYLHLNKNEYYAGDVIWFKAYIAQADTHKPDTAETTLFVDLCNINGNIIEQRILKVEQGYTHGDFFLPDSMVAGNHIIRAYTTWMLNFGEDFIFEQPIFINNTLEKKLISKREARNNRRINRELDKREVRYSIEFFPEGGIIVEGLENRIAFFASNALHEGIDISGYIADSDGKKVAVLETSFQGKGHFKLLPVSGQRYTAHVKFPNKKKKVNPFKTIQKEGLLLKIKPKKDTTSFIIERTYASPEVPVFMANPYLVIHKRGKIHQMINLSDAVYPYTFSISSKELSAGVYVATLFGTDAEVLAERLFFNVPEKETDYSISLEKHTDQLHDLKIQFDTFTADSAAYSVSVNAAAQSQAYPTHNIKTNLYLTSDILLPVQNPSAYFEGENYLQRADLLMLVSSWKRFSWNEILKEQSQEKISRTNGFPLYGAIIATKHSKETDNTDFEVSLNFGEDSRIYTTRTDSEGKFWFEGLEKEGEYEAEITLLSINRSSPESIEMFPNPIENDKQRLDFNSQRLIQKGSPGWWLRSSKRQHSSDRVIQLHDETKQPGYGNPDQTVYLKDNDIRYKNMRDIITRNVSGVRIDGYSIIIRGKSSINFTNQPLILVDGIQFTSRQFLNIPPVEISHIDIFKGSNSAIFGLRGANGAIIAHSRRGQNPEKIIFNYVLEGYYIPQNFSGIDANLKDIFFEDKNYTQTIFWNHYLNISETGKATLRIPLSQMPPFITVTLQGLDKEGNVVHSEKEFETGATLP